MPESLSDTGSASQASGSQLSSLSGQFPDPIPGVMPFGSFSLLVGAPKVGKTALYTSWIPRWLTGRTICGLPTHRPTEIGILTTDHKWRLNQGVWCRRSGVEDIRHYALRDDAALEWANLRNSWQSRRKLLEVSVDRLALPPGSLLIIDVATVFITNKLNDYNEVVAGIGTITQLFDERQLTTFGIGHMSKQRSDPKDRYLRAHERITGSGAQIGFSDTAMYLLGPEDTGEAYHTFGWLPTDGAAGEFKFKQNQDTGLFEPFRAVDEQVPVDDPLYQVIATFPDPPETLTTAEVMTRIEQVCQVKETAAKERMYALIADGRIRKSRHGRFIKQTLS